MEKTILLLSAHNFCRKNNARFLSNFFSSYQYPWKLIFLSSSPSSKSLLFFYSRSCLSIYRYSFSVARCSPIIYYNKFFPSLCFCSFLQLFSSTWCICNDLYFFKKRRIFFLHNFSIAMSSNNCSSKLAYSSKADATTLDGEKEEEKVSKKALKKVEKEAAKAAKKAERELAISIAQSFLDKKVKDEEEGIYGFLPIIQSAKKTLREWIEIPDISESLGGKKIWVRGRIQDSRGKGSLCFITLRYQLSTIQGVIELGKGFPKEMVKWTAALPWESVVDVFATVHVPEKKFEATTQNAELLIEKIFCISKAATDLPFQFRDVNRPEEDENYEENNEIDKNKELNKNNEKKEYKNEEEESNDEEKKKREGQQLADEKPLARVKQDTRLDNRILDLRVPVNQAIFRIQSETCQLFRTFLLQNNFVEIHSPKLIAGASEGGANVFTLKYFGRDACLAQSPQLYKQMAICGDFERVFEIGPVFRAENSNTYRHMCEFVGLDLEMTFKEHYFEVLNFIEEMFKFIFEGINTKCLPELEEVRRIYKFENFKWLPNFPKIDFADAVEMLRDEGAENIPKDIYEFDLSTELEKRLGKIVKKKYNTDFYAIVKYPLKVRPFYSMPSHDNPAFSNTYDVFMRGEEILSGAQRVHDAELLEKRAKECEIDVHTIKSYIDSFKLGVNPHAGCGVGLERVVMLFLGLNNIRKAALFPRDPKRLTP